MQTLILFFKKPKKNHVKTRLAKSIGKRQALKTYKILLHLRLNSLKLLRSKYNIVYYQNKLYRWPFKHFFVRKWQLKNRYHQQSKGDLGAKMLDAMKRHLKKPGDKVVIIGSDIPFLSHSILDEAFSSLKHSDVVLGPAKDGGYYLIGASKLYPSLFENITWSSSKVFSQTLTKIKKKNIKNKVLMPLFDIDDESALNKFYGIM